MPITENNFTAAELQAAVTANPALFAEIQNGVKPLGHHAFLKDEYDSFVSSERTRIAGEERSTIYSSIDKDVLDTSGIPKVDGNEKTYDYVKRVIGNGGKQVNDLNTKIKDLEKKIAEGTADQSVKDQLEAAKQKLEKLEKEDMPSYQQKLFAKDVELQFELAMQKLKIKADLPEILLKPALDTAKAELIKSAKADASGKIYYIDSDGKAMLNGVNNASALDILSSRLKDILDSGPQQPGTGTGAPSGGNPTGIKNADGNDIVIPETVKTKVQLMEFLQKQGLPQDSKDFNELFAKHGEKLPLR